MNSIIVKRIEILAIQIHSFLKKITRCAHMSFVIGPILLRIYTSC